MVPWPYRKINLGPWPSIFPRRMTLEANQTSTFNNLSSMSESARVFSYISLWEEKPSMVFYHSIGMVHCICTLPIALKDLSFYKARLSSFTWSFLDLWTMREIIHCDNQSCIKISKNPVFHDRSIHMEMRYHYLRDMVQRRAISLRYIPTD